MNNIPNKVIKYLLVLAAILLLATNSIAADDTDQIEIVFSSKLKVNNNEYTGDVDVKVAIIDEGRVSLWSNDLTSIYGSEPSSSFRVAVLESVFNITLGEDSMVPLPATVFNGSGKIYAIIWLDAGEGFEKFEAIPISVAPRAANALLLGGRPASEYLTINSNLSISNDNISEPINNSNLQAFSDLSNTFTIGDNTTSSDKIIEVAKGGAHNPNLRYNTISSQWQYSNDGVAFGNMGEASAFLGTGSLTNSVDLGTAEVSGILDIANGGTGAATAATARSSLGLEIGVDVQGFLKNNNSAVTAPLATDDSTAGYSLGSLWVNTAANTAYIAVDVTPAAAIWVDTATTSIDNSDITEAILSSNLAAFSNSNNTFTIGDAAAGQNKLIEVAAGGATNPNLRYNTTTSRWQYSNDGLTFGDFGEATTFLGTGSTTNSVDLSTSEVAGTLSIANGGTGATSASLARSSLGLEIGVNVQAYKKNNYSGVAAPTATDDFTAGYSVGSLWVDVVGETAYIAVDVTPTAAVWVDTVTTPIPDESIDSSKIDQDAVGTSEIEDDSIVDEDISPTAAIDHSKLASMSPGQVLIGDGLGRPTATDLSGDAVVDSSGEVSLTADSVDGGNIALGSDARGDIMYYDGTLWTRLPAGTTGNVLTTNGAGANPTWASVGNYLPSHAVFGRRYGYCQPLTAAATVLTAVGMTTPTVTVAGTAQPLLAERMYVRYATTAVLNNANGITGPLTETRPAFRPRYSTKIMTDASVASRRIWAGLTSAVLTALTTNTTLSLASGTTFAAIAYNTAGVGDNTGWLCCSGDGVNYSCDTMGVTVMPSTEYTLVVDWSVAGTLTCSVNGTSVNKTTNLSTAPTNMGPYNSVTTLSLAIVYHNIASQALEQN